MGLFQFLVVCSISSLLSAANNDQIRIQAAVPACNYSTVWVDMVFVFDASSAMGDLLLETAWTYTAATLAQFNLQYPNYTTSNYTSRLGIVTYGDNAMVYRELGTVDNEDMTNITGLPYNGDENTNLEDGIRTAMEQLEGSNHRPNAQRIIVIMAATYWPRGQSSPLRIADNFKERGIIIVYNVFKLGADIETLKDIASPGYFLSMKGGSQHDLPDALCDTNCYCPVHTYSYLNNSRGSPISGCYSVVNLSQNFIRATVICSTSNGIIASDETANKTMFLTSLIPNTSFYIGLRWNNTNQNWQWMNGSPVDGYQPWEKGIVPSGSSNTSVIITPLQTWIVTDSRNGYQFCCQNPVCNSNYYCS